MTGTERERVLEFQVSALADRLACVAFFLEDCTELMRQDGTVREDAFHALLTAALKPTDELIFEDIRDLPEYKAALASVRVLLQHKLKEAKNAGRENDRTDQVSQAG